MACTSEPSLIQIASVIKIIIMKTLILLFIKEIIHYDFMKMIFIFTFEIFLISPATAFNFNFG